MNANSRLNAASVINNFAASVINNFAASVINNCDISDKIANYANLGIGES